MKKTDKKPKSEGKPADKGGEKAAPKKGGKK